MVDTLKNNWGIYGSSSAVVATISCVVPGFAALFGGFVAVLLGFWGAKKHQKLSQTGLLIGGVVLLFANIVNMGIIPAHRFVQSDKVHLINSINGSIRAFDAMKDGKLNDQSREELLEQLRYALNEAKMVDITNVDSQVAGFSDHYSEEFIFGIESLMHGYENNDVFKKLQGGTLLDKWAIWSQENRKDMEKINKPELSFFSFIYGIIVS